MTEIINRNIKDIIIQFPAIAEVLNEYGIGCTTCNVGTCMLKDIVEIHNLSVEDESALLTKIAAIVFPGRKVAIPRLPRKYAGSGTNKKLSPPLQLLIQEHLYIKRVITAIPSVTASLKQNLADQKEIIGEIVDFIRNYADKFHHAKEEELLFKQFDQSNDIITVMLKEHEIGRNHVKEVIAGLERNDPAAIIENLSAYRSLLKEHIRKEDEILYPWMDRNLSDSQIGKLYADFLTAENSFGESPRRYVTFAENLPIN